MLKELLLNELQNTINRIKSGQCEMSNDDMEGLLKIFGHLPMSKSDAYNYMHMSRTTFDYKISKGEIPPGQKRRGFNELVWYKDQLDLCKKNN